MSGIWPRPEEWIKPLTPNFLWLLPMAWKYLWHFCYFRSNNSAFLVLKSMIRSSPPDVFLGKVILKICSKFTKENPYQSVISIKLLCNFIEIVLRHGYSPVTLLHIFKTRFCKNTFGGLLLHDLFKHSHKK